MVKGNSGGPLARNCLRVIFSNVKMLESKALTHIVSARDYFEAVVGIVQDSDQEVFDCMVRYQEEICEMVPETHQMLQNDNAFDDVELQDPLVVFKEDDIV